MRAALLFITFVITTCAFSFFLAEDDKQILPIVFTAYLSIVNIFLLYCECKPNEEPFD